VLGVLAVVFSVWAILGAGMEAVLWGAALLAAGIPVYLLMKYRRVGAATPADGPA
jgi:basic amino acid/polyamine antiporter, APA family